MTRPLTSLAAAMLVLGSLQSTHASETPDNIYVIRENAVVATFDTDSVDIVSFHLPKGVAIPGKVVFFDDFEQESPTPDPQKWELCKRSTPDWARHLSESYDNAYVENGMLKLVGRVAGGEYSTGGVQTAGRFSFKYGRVDVKARFVEAQGSWPAIWMMPQKPMWSGWPQCGEIDIMEHLNHDGNVYQTVHTNYRDNLGMESNHTAFPPINNGGFNIYSLVWTPDHLEFMVNDIVTLTFVNRHLDNEADFKQWPFDTDFYLILNQALGGAGTWPGAITDSELPAMMEVDWVRVSELDVIGE